MAPAVVGASQLRGGDSPGPARNRDHCLNRSEVYALTREAINKRKHLGDVKGVCAHLFDDSFSAQSDYIRENLATAFIVVGDNCRERKHLGQHAARFDRVFSLKRRTLYDEYHASAGRYGDTKPCRKRRFSRAAQVRDQPAQQERLGDQSVQDSPLRKEKDLLPHQGVGGVRPGQENGQARQEEQSQQ
uniref:Late expression factor 11 n=1 Tax=Lymantria dispar multicapsid nuclear polyhedrosis virus TaxID=10449 RepID=A0A140HRA1_NPVLD|nr:LEF-11 [Lymantria dispar multiple nucleopolyhedrovirus]AMO65537.1 lef-11 [Lymantria dispar multiple nucleopolyhedrovirus]AWJ76660.1 lef-11 [Lymantria dispar multiple nucleopolyhedrovirus]WAK98398.1 ORF45 Ld-lef11 [Lymantria dispar multiple nucleopolyhedrovirus]